MPDAIDCRFPGDPMQLPTASEWDAAEQYLHTIPGVPTDATLDRSNPNRTCWVSPYSGNRARLRVQLRRHLRRHQHALKAKVA